MAEFCLNCWNEIHRTHFTEREFIISEDYDLCEGCGEISQVVVRFRQPSDKYRLKEILKRIRKKR